MSDEIQLTPEDRELEAALKTLRPTPARINDAIAAPARSSWRQLAAAAALVAVVGGAWLTLRGPEPATPRLESELTTTDFALEPPTLIAYRRALAKSPAALDAMLDRQAVGGSAADDRVTPIRTLHLWNPDLPSSLGEM